MTTPFSVQVRETDLDAIAMHTGPVAVFLAPSGKLDQTARRLNRLTKGAIERLVESEGFADMEEGGAKTLHFPTGVQSEVINAFKLAR